MESSSNLRMFCDEHSPKADPRWKERELNFFTDKLVKRGFATGDPKVHIEHMWVEVTGIEGEKLVGTLANDPVWCEELCFGDTVLVDRADIESVFDKTSRQEVQP